MKGKKGSAKIEDVQEEDDGENEGGGFSPYHPNFTAEYEDLILKISMPQPAKRQRSTRANTRQTQNCSDRERRLRMFQVQPKRQRSARRTTSRAPATTTQFTVRTPVDYVEAGSSVMGALGMAKRTPTSTNAPTRGFTRTPLAAMAAMQPAPPTDLDAFHATEVPERRPGTTQPAGQNFASHSWKFPLVDNSEEIAQYDIPNKRYPADWPYDQCMKAYLDDDTETFPEPPASRLELQ